MKQKERLELCCISNGICKVVGRKIDIRPLVRVGSMGPSFFTEVSVQGLQSIIGLDVQFRSLELIN